MSPAPERPLTADAAPAPTRRVWAWRFPINAQLLTIVLVFVSEFVLFLLLVALSFRVATGVRAYVGGEGLWSKGQKDAVYYLQRYAWTQEPADFEKYQSAVAIPLGDRLAREEMQKPDFDRAVVERGFVQGLNSPRDVPALIFLFRRFEHYGPMERAIGTWTRGDEGIEELQVAAADLDSAIRAGRLEPEVQRGFMDRIEQINGRLTPIEREFSSTLNEAAREVRDVLLGSVLATAVLLLLVGVSVAWRIARGLRRGLDAISSGVGRVEQGNLGQPIELQSRDELGDLAKAFDEMMIHRQQAERDLQQHADDLARSNAELEQFAYVASHDLQEPLRTVASYAQLLVRRAQGKLGPESDEFVHHINDAVVRMRTLIEDLLSYSRSTRATVDPVATDLNGLLATALSNLESAISSAQAQVTHDPLPTVPVIPHLITQLFQNLIGNALKFRGEEPPQVHVAVRRLESEWEFSIRDNGIGIEPEHSERIFVLFQRLHPRERYSGSGLGLAICKKIVEQEGGKIRVEPSDSGADIRFTLPVRKKA